MAQCNYIIKNPVGEDIIIPADFGLLTNDTNLQDLHKKALEGNTYNLLQHIKKEIGESIHELEISSIISENLNDLDTIVNQINEVIPQSNEYQTFEKALYKHLLDTKESNSNRADDIRDSLNSPLTLEYFDGVSGILNQTSVSKVHSSIKANAVEMTNFGIYPEVLREMSKFLDAIKNIDNKFYRSNALLANQSILGIHSSNVGNFTVYNENDITSLFLGLFKRLGNKLDVGVLESEFGDVDYFKTNINEGEVMLTPFENDLLSDSTESIKRVNKAIEVISQLNPNPSFSDSINNLFKYLEPGVELDNQNQRIYKTNLTLQRETKFEVDFKTNRYSESLKETSKDLDSHYGSENTVWRNIDSFMEDTLTIGEDLVYFEDVDDYALLTEYHKQSDGQMYMRGMRRVGRTNEYVYQTLAKNQGLKYRVKETHVLDPYIKGDKITPNKNIAQVTSQTGFPEQLLKTLLKKGDMISDTHIVGGTYPTYVMAGNLKTGKIEKIAYSNITTFSSEVLGSVNEGTDWGLFNHLQTINDMSTLSQGDKIKDPLDGNRIKTVVQADEKSVYVLRDGKILPTPKDTIKGARLDTLISLSNTDINRVKYESGSALNESSSFSVYTDPELVNNGDFFITHDGTVGKIADRNSKKALVIRNGNREVITLNNDVDTFFTDRALVSKHTPFSLRVNNFLIHTNMNSVDGTAKYVKAMYVVPKRTTQNSLYLFPNNFANIGKWIPAKDFSPSKEADFTEFMKKKIAQRDRVEIDSVDPHLEMENDTDYKNDMTGIEEVKGFYNLAEDVKQAVAPLIPGTQFRLHQGGSVSEDIYTIVGERGGKLIAEKSKTTLNGTIITGQLLLDRDILLSSGESSQGYSAHNSIANLYLRVGDPNHIAMAQAIKNDLNLDQVKDQNSINLLKEKMAETFSRIGMTVTEDTEGFQEGQKAKITTTDEGETSIVLNTAEGDYSDLVHENLHIQLVLLRYNDINQYSNLIDSLTARNQDFLGKHGEDSDISTKEEFVVNELVRLSKGQNNFLYGNLVGFMDAVSAVMEEHFGHKHIFQLQKNTSNYIEFLNTPMRQFYDINSEDSSHPFYNMGLIAAEPFLREWMQKNNIKIIC